MATEPGYFCPLVTQVYASHLMATLLHILQMNAEKTAVDSCVIDRTSY